VRIVDLSHGTVEGVPCASVLVVTFLLIALVVSIALDIVEYAWIKREERLWNERVEFYAAQKEADSRRYANDGGLR
jgi:hypothetical protein